jgi:hypothetical protein
MLGQEFAVCFVKQPLLSGALASEQHLLPAPDDYFLSVLAFDYGGGKSTTSVPLSLS